MNLRIAALQAAALTASPSAQMSTLSTRTFLRVSFLQSAQTICIETIKKKDRPQFLRKRGVDVTSRLHGKGVSLVILALVGLAAFLFTTNLSPQSPRTVGLTVSNTDQSTSICECPLGSPGAGEQLQDNCVGRDKQACGQWDCSISSGGDPKEGTRPTIRKAKCVWGEVRECTCYDPNKPDQPLVLQKGSIATCGSHVSKTCEAQQCMITTPQGNTYPAPLLKCR